MVPHSTRYGITDNAISGKTMQTAIALTEYFRATALKVYRKIFVENPTGLDKKSVIKYLHKEGASQNDIAAALKVSQPYVNKILQNIYG